MPRHTVCVGATALAAGLPRGHDTPAATDTSYQQECLSRYRIAFTSGVGTAPRHVIGHQMASPTTAEDGLPVTTLNVYAYYIRGTATQSYAIRHATPLQKATPLDCICISQPFFTPPDYCRW